MRILWDKLKYILPNGSQPKHLLWCLFFLKLYTSDHNRAAFLKADEKTVRKWTWIFISLVANLDLINLDQRFEHAQVGQNSFCSIDGVDFKIYEPKPFIKKWFSHKFRSAGLRYEIALCVRSGKIVWMHGGYPCGDWPDLKLARDAYLDSIDEGERTFADKGYRDPAFILPNEINARHHKLIMSRHETINKRIRHFNVLKTTFRHNIIHHPKIFYAICNITQLVLTYEEPLFSVNII